jgi:glyoxylase-like metal-dependent hydrolase (beta-lactamase superfamily II)
VLPAQDGLLNSGVLLGAHVAVVIDPSAAESDLATLDGLLEEGGSHVAVVALTHDRAGMTPDLGRWPEAEHLIPQELSGTRGVPPGVAEVLSALGWEALFFGPGRLALYSPRERALFCGDMLSEAHIPYLRDGGRVYLETLAEIERLDCRLIVPAAGPVAKGKRAVRTRIERDRDYVNSLVRHVQTSLAAGAGLERALEVARTVYEDYPFVEEHLSNLRTVWQEVAESAIDAQGLGS